MFRSRLEVLKYTVCNLKCKYVNQNCTHTCLQIFPRMHSFLRSIFSLDLKLSDIPDGIISRVSFSCLSPSSSPAPTAAAAVSASQTHKLQLLKDTTYVARSQECQRLSRSFKIDRTSWPGIRVGALSGLLTCCCCFCSFFLGLDLSWFEQSPNSVRRSGKVSMKATSKAGQIFGFHMRIEHREKLARISLSSFSPRES